MQGEEFNFGAHYMSANGELMFGGPNGYNRFEPWRCVTIITTFYLPS